MNSDFTIRILTTISEKGGQVDLIDLKIMYIERGDGQRFNARIIRPGLAEWLRNDSGVAYAARLTEAGREMLTHRNG